MALAVAHAKLIGGNNTGLHTYPAAHHDRPITSLLLDPPDISA